MNETPKSLSPGRIALRRLRRNKIAITGMLILTFLYLLAIFAGFFSPYSPVEQEFRSYFFHPPVPLHFRDERGTFRLRPFVLATHLVDRENLNYSAAVPFYVYYRRPDANTNPYYPDTLEDEKAILTATTDKGKRLAEIRVLQETESNSGIFF